MDECRRVRRQTRTGCRAKLSRSITRDQTSVAERPCNRCIRETLNDGHACPDVLTSTVGRTCTTWSTRAPAVRTLASSLGCSRASGRVACWNWRAARVGSPSHWPRPCPMLRSSVWTRRLRCSAKAPAARDASEPQVRQRVSFVKGDMRDWPGSGDAFDAVIVACCSVSHLITLDDRRRTWATAFRLLRPGGVFILDVRVPDLATLAEAQRVRPRAFVDLDIDTARRAAGEDERLLRGTATTYEPHLQRADVRLIYDRFDQGALAERLVTDFASHIYFPAELELLFLSAGFEISHQYGDYRFVRVDRASPYVVTVARRPRRSGRRPDRNNRRSALRFEQVGTRRFVI